MIDKRKLTTELETFYRRTDLHQYAKLSELLTFLVEHNLDICLREITKVLKILLTIPMTTSEAERSFSALKRIKTFLRNTVGQQRLNALAAISTEKNFFNSHPNLKELVIESFIRDKARRMDIIFK